MTIVARRWWTLALRGAAAILFGVISLTAPGITLLSLVLMFGIYAIVDGVLSVSMAARDSDERHWGAIILRGLVTIAAGLLALAWPGITLAFLITVIGFWAIMSGALEIAAAVRLRREIKGEWLLALEGAVAIAFGVLVLIAPVAGALVLAMWIGAFAIVLGGVLLGAAFRLRSLQKGAPTPPSAMAPPGYAPA